MKTKSIGTFLITLAIVVASGFESCKKADSGTPTSSDKLIGTWKAADQGPSQVDVYQFNAGGTGTDTRTLGQASPIIVNFSWSVDAQDVMTVETLNWTHGEPSATIDGRQHIESNDGTTLVVKSVSTPGLSARTFTRL